MLARERPAGRDHAACLLPMVDELLAAAELRLRNLNAIAFGRGPGAFTGVRLAASVTQGLAFAAAVPVVPISDLRALAQRALQEYPHVARVLACTDARMREVYWGCFARGPQDLAAAVGDEHVSAPERVAVPADWYGQAEDSAWIALGTGFVAHPRLRESLAPAVFVLDGVLPRAREIAALAVPEVGAGRVLPAEQALPVYLRDDVTQTPHRQSLN